jgi:hypothetical protein
MKYFRYCLQSKQQKKIVIVIKLFFNTKKKWKTWFLFFLFSKEDNIFHIKVTKRVGFFVFFFLQIIKIMKKKSNKRIKNDNLHVD